MKQILCWEPTSLLNSYLLSLYPKLLNSWYVNPFSFISVVIIKLSYVSLDLRGLQFYTGVLLYKVQTYYYISCHRHRLFMCPDSIRTESMDIMEKYCQTAILLKANFQAVACGHPTHLNSVSYCATQSALGHCVRPCNVPHQCSKSSWLIGINRCIDGASAQCPSSVF